MGLDKYQQAMGSQSSENDQPQDVELQPGVGQGEDTPIEFVSDVALSICVEFARTTLSIAELVKLKRGSIIAFDKEKDSGMDFRVNGNKVATGEVVVVNENYGVRITSIQEPDFFDDSAE